jgi:hypothetical protein
MAAGHPRHMGWIPYAWASCFSYSLIETAISEPFRVDYGSDSGIMLAPTNGSDEQFTSNVWAIFASSAFGTASLAFELLKTWGLA